MRENLEAISLTQGNTRGVVVRHKEEGQECDHQGKWHLCPGPYKIVRFCGGCGKSWWLPARDDMLGMGPDDRIIQEWEEVKEPVKVEQLIVGDYGESAIALNDIYDEGDDDEEDEEGMAL